MMHNKEAVKLKKIRSAKICVKMGSVTDDNLTVQLS